MVQPTRANWDDGTSKGLVISSLDFIIPISGFYLKFHMLCYILGYYTYDSELTHIVGKYTKRGVDIHEHSNLLNIIHVATKVHVILRCAIPLTWNA